jgi:hypothetical protein
VRYAVSLSESEGLTSPCVLIAYDIMQHFCLALMFCFALLQT